MTDLIEARARRLALQQRLRDVEGRTDSLQKTYDTTRSHRSFVKLQDARHASIMAYNDWMRAVRSVRELEKGNG